KIFEEFPALIWRSRLDKLCDYFNKTWLDFTGRTLEEEFGNGWTERLHPDDFDYCLNIYTTSFEKKEPFVMEYRLKDKFDEYRWIRDYGRPFYDLDNSFLGYIGSCYDITENKRNEEKLIKMNDAKDKFFSIIAHDLRNPIFSYIAITDFLSSNHRDLSEEELTGLAGEMNKSARNTLKLLENLLEWSKTQLEDISIKPEEIKFQEICKEVIEEINGSAKAKQINITYPEKTNIKINADKNMLKTVLRNLATNAIKFSYTGNSININAILMDGNINITITDYGIGMDKNEIDNLFNLKKIKSNKGTFNETGSGLGLLICKDFIDKHNGKIWVESEPGKGSNFTITLPV
ncbi:MAG: PAS domain-containing sensor histidine kinase, partial [Leptospiraceae bacterium]|nr:PAS domain-containing sensor histidine kinase [Leptospiraceae bacterium]